MTNNLIKNGSKGSKSLSVAVVGAGASGMMAAVSAAEHALKTGKHVSVSLYESGQRVGKKILVTGNGRCNLTNTDIRPEFYRGSPELFAAVYGKFTREDTLAFFEREGLFTRIDNAGRVYPMSNQASSVLDVLRGACDVFGVKEVLSSRIISVEKKENGFLLNGNIYADRVIIACGGKAAPVHGSDGSGYALLKSFGVEITPLYPALTALNIADFTKSLKGIRAEGELTLRASGKVMASAHGELQYTEYGISGIPAMQVSRFAAEAIGDGCEVIAFVDSVPGMSAEKLNADLLRFVKTHPETPVETMLAGLMPKRLGVYIASQCSVQPSKPVGVLHENVVRKLTASLKRTKYKVVSVRGFADAQVTAGGVAAHEINAATMGIKKVKGLYVCGEIADVDGDCGGYNLQWAFSSGAVAGKSSVEEI